MVLGSNVGGSRNLDPVSFNLRAAQHRFDPLTTLIGNDQDGCSLATRATGTARAMLQTFGIARQLDMNDERKVGQIDTTCSNVGRDTNACAPVAERLQGLVTLGLAMLA